MAKAAAAKASRKSAEKSAIVSLKVTLNGIKPPIWRRLLVAESMTLAGLHEAIQTGMGWSGGHLHSFDIDGEQYGNPKEFTDVADQRRITLARLVKSGVKRFTYTYDFGDDWEHLVD